MILACAQRTHKFKDLSVKSSRQICSIIRDPGFGESNMSNINKSLPNTHHRRWNDFSRNIRKVFIPAVSKLQDILQGMMFISFFE
jgi:hypothetical protein